MKSILITLVCIFFVQFSYSQSLVVNKTDGSKTTIALSNIESITFEDSGLADLTDSRDGHVYKTVKIGTQTWMAENLAYLPAVSTSQEASLTTPYYYVYGYEGSTVSEAKATANYGTYGVLYNWPAALTACPSGWHLPTDAEWTTLEDYLGALPGKKMKSIAGWSVNGNGDNSSGFNALPGGDRYHGGGFYNLGSYAFFWSASESDSDAWSRSLNFNYDGVDRYGDIRRYGFSARCLQN